MPFGSNSSTESLALWPFNVPAAGMPNVPGIGYFRLGIAVLRAGFGPESKDSTPNQIHPYPDHHGSAPLCDFCYEDEELAKGIAFLLGGPFES